MSENFYKLLRSSSLEELEAMVSEAHAEGWYSVGKTDHIGGEYIQAIKYLDYEDDPTEMITIPNAQSEPDN